MDSIANCALIGIDGEVPERLFQDLLSELLDKCPVTYCTDLTFPTSSDASEESAWLALLRFVGIAPSQFGIRVIVHRYSSDRVLVAVVCDMAIADRSRLYALLKKGLIRFGSELNATLTSGVVRSSLEVGALVDCGQLDCRWDGPSQAPEPFLAFLSASLVCQYLLSGHPTSAVDVLLPNVRNSKENNLVSIQVAASLDRTIGSIREEIRGLLRSGNSVLFSRVPRSTAVVFQEELPLPELNLKALDSKIALLAVQTVGPWRVKVSLPSPTNQSRMECTGVFTPATLLLPELCRAAESKPDLTIRQLSHVLEIPTTTTSHHRVQTPVTVVETMSQRIHKATMKRTSITVASLKFGDLPYAAHSRAINDAYCALHGYSYRTITPPVKVERHSVWYKVKGMETLLETSDFVLFLDADAYFYDHSRSIESLITDHMGDSALMLGTDRRDKDFAYSDDEGNTGVFIVRRCAEGFAILKEWWDAPLREDASEWLWCWPVEQAVMNDCLRKGRHANAIKLIYYEWMNGRDGTYIRHLVGTPEEDRLAILRRAREALLGASPER